MSKLQINMNNDVQSGDATLEEILADLTASGFPNSSVVEIYRNVATGKLTQVVLRNESFTSASKDVSNARAGTSKTLFIPVTQSGRDITDIITRGAALSVGHVLDFSWNSLDEAEYRIARAVGGGPTEHGSINQDGLPAMGVVYENYTVDTMTTIGSLKWDGSTTVTGDAGVISGLSIGEWIQTKNSINAPGFLGEAKRGFEISAKGATDVTIIPGGGIIPGTVSQPTWLSSVRNDMAGTSLVAAAGADADGLSNSFALDMELLPTQELGNIHYIGEDGLPVLAESGDSVVCPPMQKLAGSIAIPGGAERYAMAYWLAQSVLGDNILDLYLASANSLLGVSEPVNWIPYTQAVSRFV